MGKKYKILIISDTEILGRYPMDKLKKMFSDIDFIISAGDLGNDYLDYLFTTLNKDIIYVNGNHVHKKGHDISFCKNIDGKIIRYKGLKIFGLGGSKKYSYQENQYSEFEMTQRIILNLGYLFWGRKLDIMVTHTPPRRINDREDFTHQGFEVFHKILKYFKPKLWIHGHIHLVSHMDTQETTIGDTRIINAYGYKVIEYMKN
ncbi:metallophosphoesterase family protein [Psychrilyobacter atlanticus]|uniref:metallophosphoesterase family protein n=1 Tax=Psychrilyobacter atlanticus TaxID=271091 RepID=UPI0004184995|nr:metallophosphoesterase [Psychrilyobacter atlanticus]